jgi:hypothetical protein
MDYSAIIKRAWQVTWRYKALWVLGVFAGVSGCSSSGGSNYSSKGGSGADSGIMPSLPSSSQIQEWLLAILPALIALVILLFVVGIAWSVLSIAARGGLIVGVNEIEEGREPALPDLWRAGFARFWSLVGLDIILWLPMFLLAILFVVAVAVPIIAAAAAGSQPDPVALVGPLCGSLAVGLPVLLVASFVLGIMYFLAQRYIMLGGQGAVQAAGNSWRFLRARFKDTGLMWLVNAGLNFVASMVVAIPMVAIGLVAAVPLLLAIGAKNWGAVAALGAVFVIAAMAVSLLYSAVWGTFTSALWTIFFRKVAGMAPAETPPVAGYPPVQASHEAASGGSPAFVAPQYPPPPFPASPPQEPPGA